MSNILNDFCSDHIMLSVVAEYIIGGSSADDVKLNPSDDSSDTETVYGIRTNFNAVNEYLNLLIKYLKDNVDKINFTVDTVYNPQKKLGDVYLLRNTNVNQIPDDELKAEHVKCWLLETNNGSILNDKMFNDLENEILVNFFGLIGIIVELPEYEYHERAF